jgi:hypothetical protein
MTAAEIIVLGVGSVLVIAGLAVIVSRETMSEPWRSIEPRTRQLVEVLLPVLGATLLLGALWAGVR